MATGEVFISRKICTTYEHTVYFCKVIQCAGLKSVPGQLWPPGFMFALRHFHICFPSLEISVVETPDVFLHLKIVKKKMSLSLCCSNCNKLHLDYLASMSLFKNHNQVTQKNTNTWCDQVPVGTTFFLLSYAYQLCPCAGAGVTKVLCLWQQDTKATPSDELYWQLASHLASVVGLKQLNSLMNNATVQRKNHYILFPGCHIKPSCQLSPQSHHYAQGVCQHQCCHTTVPFYSPTKSTLGG